jgi:tRNA threonylcarbamoyladenosine biosynthesis protein TsaB
MILAINTSTTQFGIALLSAQGDISAECLISPGEKNFKSFMPAVNSLFEACGADTKTLKAVVAAIGPGSFTGLRVGLSLAKGMAQGLKIPVIGVSSLEAMANQLPFAVHPLCTLLSSRRGEVIFALFAWEKNKGMIRIVEDQSVSFKDLAKFIKGPTYFIGNNFSAQFSSIKELIGADAIPTPRHLWQLRASAIGNLGLSRFNVNDFDDLRDLVPEYLRPPDIRPNPFV